MTSSPDSTLVMLGLSGTGKTHFLVALDVILDHQTDPDGLIHSDFASDRAYLQPLREQWLRGEDLDHTSRSLPPPPHPLLVNHPASGVSAGLLLPDLAGETFESHFITRSMPIDLCDQLKEAGGLLLFVHCNPNADHPILRHPEFVDSEPAPDESGSILQGELTGVWNLEQASPQVKIVDLLQFIVELRSKQQPLRVAVIVSAWDLVETAQTLGPGAAAEMPNDPSKFLKVRWPLLDQFLRTQVESFSFRAFGVSARGGGTSPAEVARLIQLDGPSDRITIVDGKHRSNDLTRPVRWLLRLLSDGDSSDG